MWPTGGKNSVRFFCLVLGLIVLVVTCNAPRKNPLDPKNPDYPYGALSGSVQTLSLPNRPLSGVSVCWSPGMRTILTDNSGTYNFEDIEPKNGWLMFSKSGYYSDSVWVEWAGVKKRHISIMLNAMPRLERLEMFSVVKNRYPSIRNYEVIVRAAVSDDDNDIDSVRIENARLEVQSVLDFNMTEKWYEKQFNTYTLNIESINEIIGLEFSLTVIDKFSRRVELGQISVERIIYDEVSYESPSGYQIVAPNPMLSWHAFDPGFDFTFMVEIYTNEILPQKVWHRYAIQSDSTSVTVDQALSPGDYFWVIWCVDDYQNRSRSKPASFTVQ